MFYKLFQNYKKKIWEAKRRNSVKIKNFHQSKTNNNKNLLIKILIYTFFLIISGFSFGFLLEFLFQSTDFILIGFLIFLFIISIYEMLKANLFRDLGS
jgi:undecaprenyl pyrophosphate phosphatase UppP